MKVIHQREFRRAMSPTAQDYLYEFPARARAVYLGVIEGGPSAAHPARLGEDVCMVWRRRR